MYVHVCTWYVHVYVHVHMWSSFPCICSLYAYPVLDYCIGSSKLWPRVTCVAHTYRCLLYLRALVMNTWLDGGAHLLRRICEVCSLSQNELSHCRNTITSPHSQPILFHPWRCSEPTWSNWLKSWGHYSSCGWTGYLHSRRASQTPSLPITPHTVVEWCNAYTYIYM